MRKHLITLLIGVSSVAALGQTNVLEIPGAYWNLDADFSLFNNPNGVWSYGRKQSVRGANLYVLPLVFENQSWWLGNWGIGGPAIWEGRFWSTDGAAMWAKYNVDGYYPVVRWRCPKRGSYKVEGRFIGADSRGMDSLVYVVVNGNMAFSSRIRRYLQTAPFSIGPVAGDEGGVVDFVVVWGGGVYSEYSVTGLNATITSVGPEMFQNPEGFEGGLNGWFTSGPIQWQIRRPGNGPGNAHSGIKAACSNLGDSYNSSASCRLVSPRFIIPSLSGDDRVILRFWQWYQYGANASGQVQISTFDGSNWQPWTTLTVAATNGTSTSWSQEVVDLTQYQAQQVRIGFYHAASSNSSAAAGWYIDDVALSGFVPGTLALGQPLTNTFTANAQFQYFVLDAPPGGHLLVNLNALGATGANELYLSRGVLPTPGSYDYRFSTNGAANQSIFAPNAGAGKWYVLAYDAGGPVPENYTLAAQFLTGVVLTSVNPSSIGNSMPGTLTINGAGFTPDATVALVGSGQTYPAGSVAMISASQLQADFDFTAIPTNTYNLTVTSGTNSASLAFSVIYGGAPRLETHLIVPAQLGRHAPATIYVEYANVGQVATPAPLLVLTGTQHPFLAAAAEGGVIPLTGFLPVSGFWTSARPIGWSETVQFLAYGDTPGILQPGESNTVAISYAGLQQPWDFSQNRVEFNLGVLLVSNTTPLDWNSIKPTMKPANFPSDAWDAIWPNLVASAGVTWGDYLRMLNGNAAYLRKLGLDVKDLNACLSFAIEQADGLNVVRSLASAADASVPSPGLSLRLSRFFPQPISGRYRLGALGRGWTHNWEFSLTVDNDGANNTPGTVTIVGPGGSQRVFQADGRAQNAGQYFSQPGDYGMLTASGTGFTLTEPNGLVWVFGSDRTLGYVQDPNGNRITLGYSGGLLTSLNHSSGQSLTLSYSGSLLQSVADSFGRTTTFAYDASGQHLASATHFDGSQVAYGYTDPATATGNPALAHALTQITFPATNHEYFTYDTRGRLSGMSLDGGASAIGFSYGQAGAVFATDASGNKTTFYLDHRLLPLKLQNPLTNSIYFSFDANLNLTRFTDPSGRTYDYAYDNNGNLVQFTDALGKQTTFRYQSPFNRLAALIDANANFTSYGSDARGNLRSIKYADASSENWQFDPAGNPTTWTNRRGQAISYQFNANGQPTLKTYPGGRTIAYNYDYRARLTNIIDSALGTTSLAYDTRDFLTNIVYPDGRGFGFSYDPAGRRTSRTSYDGYTLNYGYDLDGRLATLTDGSSNLIVKYGYDVKGRLSREDKGNGTSATYTYDVADQITALTNSAPDGTALSFFNYSYDAKGNRLTMTTAAGVTRYGYDDLNQLIDVIYPNGRHVSYTYDAIGNRTVVNDSGVSTAYTVNNLNQYTQVGGTSFRFDADGSMTNRVDASGTTTYAFDPENRLFTVITPTNGTWRYIYDSLGHRSAVVHNGVTNYFLLDPFGLVDVAAEYDSGGGLISRYDHGLGLVARVDNTGAAAFYAFDALGDTRQITGSSGSVLNSYDYDAFGAAISVAESVPNSFRFVGRFGVADELTGLHFMRARYYNSILGRFSSQDLIGIGGGLNLNSYTSNNPVTRFDPSGDTSLECWRWLWKWLKLGWLELAPEAGVEGYGHLGLSTLLDWEKQVAQNEPTFQQIVNNPNDPWNPNNPNEPSNPDNSNKPNNPKGPYNPGAPVPPTSGLPGGGSQIPVLQDPNHLTPPGGSGPPDNYTSASGTFAYRIDFEITNALSSVSSAPAQVVVISDPLTNTLDWTSFTLTEIGFGNYVFSIPAGTQHYQQTVPVTVGGVSFDVAIDASLNTSNGVLTVNYSSIDPKTGLPPQGTNGIVGFLLPEDGTGRGMGHISYLIRPEAGLPTGTQIRNVATIAYDPSGGGPTYRTDLSVPTDPNSAIDTNKQALVTIDADLPSSSVAALPAVETNSTFSVGWSGSDPVSGVVAYDIYVSVNQGPWTLWLNGTSSDSAVFTGQPNQTYAFYSVAHDGAGNVESIPSKAEAQTRTAAILTAPLITGQPASSQAVNAGDRATFNVTATGGTLNYQWKKDGVALVDGGRIGGALTAMLTLMNAQTNDSGQYQVTVSNGTTPVNSILAKLAVLPVTDECTFISVAGLAGNAGSADGQGNNARFSAPSGVAVDGAGNLYVADYWNSTVRQIASGGLVTTLAGLPGSMGSIDGTGSAARFHWPQGVAVDGAGNVYVADQANATIRELGPGGAVTTLAGQAGSTGSADGTGSAARFYDPAGVAVDSVGSVYVADYLNSTIRQIAPGGVVTTLAGLALSPGSADGAGSTARFNYPSGVAVDGAGNLYVADQLNHTIRKIAPGGVVTTVAGLALSHGSADGTGSAARFSYPSFIAVDAGGNLYVTDQVNNTIRKITPGGLVTTLAGQAGSVGSSDGTGSIARFNSPSGVAVDGAGNLYVADTGNKTIRVSVKTCPDLPVIDLATGPIGVPRQLNVAPQTAQNWQWAILQRPAGSQAQLSATNLLNPVFTPDVGDLYVFELQATNAAGAIAIRTLKFTAFDPAVHDSDGDGFTDAQESIAGTDPLDPASALRITDVEISGTDVLLSFTAVAGKQYSVESTDSLTFPNSAWIVRYIIPNSTGGIIKMIDTGAAGSTTRRFYHIVTGPNREVISEPVGFYNLPLVAGANPLSLPFAKIPIARGLVTGVSGNAVTMNGNPGWTANSFAPANGLSQHVLILLNDAGAAPGSLGIQGDWWTITGNTANSVTVSPGSDNLAALLRVGSSVAVRKLQSMKDLFGTGPTVLLNKDSTGAAASGDGSRADVIRFLSGTSFGKPIFYHDGSLLPAGYYVGSSGPLDGSTITVLPGQAFMFFRVAGSAPTIFTVDGGVNTARVTTYLQAGPNAVGIEFPAVAPVGSSNLKESGWNQDSTGAAASGDFRNADLFRHITGVSFDTSAFYHNGTLLPAGWYQGGTLNSNYTLVPGQGYIFFMKGPSTVRWRQVVPYVP